MIVYLPGLPGLPAEVLTTLIVEHATRPRAPEPLSAARLYPCCGGSAAMIGWSLGIIPSLAAPPGEPSSSKNSTFAR